MGVFLDSPRGFGNLRLLARTLGVLGVGRCYVHNPHRLIGPRYGSGGRRRAGR